MSNKAHKPPVATPESRAISAAITESKLTKAAIAEHMGVSPGLMSQWASGRSPVASWQAPKLAVMLGLDPEQISADYRKVNAEQDNVVPIRNAEHPMNAQEATRAIARLESDVHALNAAMSVLVAVMVNHRPAEASDVAAWIRRRVPAPFREAGLLGELLADLERRG